MASASTPSSSLTRYPRWVWALTGLAAAYATYTIWTTFDSPPRSNSSGLHRRAAVRQARRRSPQQQQQQQEQQQHLSANMHASTRPPTSAEDASSPFGTITAQVNNSESIYEIGPRPPSLQQLERDFNLSGATLLRIHADMQHVLLDIIIERLVESNSEELFGSCGPVYRSLLPLIVPLRDKNIVDLLGLTSLLASPGRADSEADPETEWRFEQANVALAFARRCGIDVERGNRSRLDDIDGLDIDLAETVLDSDAGGNTHQPGQGIMGLLYTIAEEQAKRGAYIHRGTRCDSCGEFPIRGVRWHCINCPDYDLCSNCESQSPGVHPRTHVFAKIKIPIATLAQPHEVHDLWYPGDPIRHWSPLHGSLRKRLVAETGFEDVALEACYEQFTCIANVPFPDDPAHINAAIDRRAFTKAMSSDKWPAPVEPNYLFDRMFKFYDTDNNQLIDFEEFVHGLAYLRQPSGLQGRKRRNMDRILQGYDADDDGLLCRADFVRMFSAKYAIQRHIIHDIITAEETEILAHTGDIIRSSQPISAAFTGEDVPYGERREPTMKRQDEYGDFQVTEEYPFREPVLPNGVEVWDQSTINSVARRYDRLEDIVREGDPLSPARAEEIRRRYNRVESCPIVAEPDIEGVLDDYGEPRYLVETDSRTNRGRSDLQSAEARWRTDLIDAISGGAAGFLDAEDTHDDLHTTIQNGHATGKEAEPAHMSLNGTISEETDHENNGESQFPDFILSRGRAYDVPHTEVDSGSEVLYQVIQDSINELIDPLFRERETLGADVRATRSERRRWRKEINQYVQDKKAFQEKTRAGAADPLIAMALESSRNRRQDPRQESRRAASIPRSSLGSLGSVASSSPSHHTGPSSPDLPQPPAEHTAEEPQDIAAEIRARIQHQNEALPTDDEGIENLERTIRQQPLDDLLASAGYSIASPIEERPSVSVDDRTIARSAAPSPSPAREDSDNTTPADSLDEMQDLDPTLPQNRPNSEIHMPTLNGHQEDNAARETEEEPMRLSPSSPPTPLPPGLSRASSASSANSLDVHYRLGNSNDRNNNEEDYASPPSSARLDYLHRLDEEERRILVRGGPGRLTFEEVEEICRRDNNRGILELVESWLEWAGF
ncbi:hypothetical protein AAFC00_002160 [Neodothiora populina]|uniref:Uncharacterized protein n=1 Tax=Neodothiora populina TaxID=2781224 RepID=A0ABR3PHN5_9PEZI